MLDRAIEVLDPGESSGLAAECRFYAYAHRPAAERDAALRELKRVLRAGARSPGWNLRPHVERAEQDGHPAGAWLRQLAAVISDGADIGSLDDWDEWRAA
jgi:hypothetical protein